MTGLTSPLPRTVIVGSAICRINTDYRLMLRFEAEILKASKGDFSGILSRYLPDFYGELQITSANAAEAVKRFMWFYACGRVYDGTTDSGGKKARRYYDFDDDAAYIYAAFLQQYGIDLTVRELHWWEFRALFAGLTDETEIVRIMQYRGTDLSKIKYKPERERLKKLQDIFTLKDSCRKRYISADERDAARLEYMRRRFAEVEKERGEING